ncbi:MAG: Calx-beta domain-containing protein, partial [Thermoanaerobaculia bacterium]
PALAARLLAPVGLECVIFEWAVAPGTWTCSGVCQGDAVGQLMTATTLWEFRLQDCSLAAGTCDRFGLGSRSFQDGTERDEWYTITVIPAIEATGNTVTYEFHVVNANVSIMGQPRFEDLDWTLSAELPFPPSDSPSAADLAQALSLAVTIHHDIDNTFFEIQWNGTATATDFASCTVVPTQLTIDDVALAEGDGGTTDFVFTVSRDHNQAAVSVTAETTDGTAQAGSDYTTTGPAVLTFPAGGTLTRTFSVPVAGETLVELDESFTVELSNPVNAAIADGSGLGTIANDDAATLGVADVAGGEGSGGGTTPFAFVVTLDAAVDTAVAVDFATADGTAEDENGDGDYAAAAGTLAFAGTAGETETATVEVTPDERPEQDEEFFVDLFGVSAGGRDVTLVDDRGAGTITDDDDACPTFTIYQQPFDSPAAPRGHPATAGPTATFEDVVDAGGKVTTLPPGPVSGLRLWGLGVDELGAPCPLDPAVRFDLFFAADDAGVPGVVLATRSGIAATIAPLTPEVARLDLVFPTIDGTDVSWISVQRPEAAGCAFQWLAEETAGTYDDAVFTPPASAPDDAYLCVGDPWIFGDDFESGDTAAWSTTVP